ncbi:MAG: ABC transporter permease subunit [Limnochordia bacterium]|jgi:simple sugar transport system permease protein
MRPETKTTQIAPQRSFGSIARNFLVGNMVTIMFLLLGLIGFLISGMSPFLFLMDIVSRFSRNTFLVLSLIIPVMAGMGLNFSIVLGAMAAQAVLIFVTHWGFKGLPGILLCFVLVTPLAMLLGYLTGNLFNRTKGQEMITGLILGFFAQGVYELIFLQLVGGVIPMDNRALVMSSGVGVRTTVDLSNGLKYGLDWPGDFWGLPYLLRPTLPWALIYVIIVGFVLCLIYYFVNKKQRFPLGKVVPWGVFALVVLIWSIIQLQTGSQINLIRVPMATWLVIAGLCLFINFFSKTKLGQDMRSVGQDRHVAAVAGIQVDRVRTIAIMMSMVMAAWGHIIFLQNMGTFSTYGSHEQIGLYAVAAILIGGATVTNATIGHALLGTFLFHTLFVVSPSAGRQLFGDAQVGEYFRVFVAYGVIGATLAMHAWRKLYQARIKQGL